MKLRIRFIYPLIFLTIIFISACSPRNELETETLTISKYTGIELDESVNKPKPISDEDVDAAILSTLRAHITSTPVSNHPAELGNIIVIDFTGLINGQPFENNSATDYQLVAGDLHFIEGFSESTVGHSIGDTYEWSSTFPIDYYDANCAGQAVTYTITIKNIFNSYIPELNDEFVRSVSTTSQTVEEYREEIKTKLESEAKIIQNETLIQFVWEKVLANTDIIKYPQTELEEMKEALIEPHKSYAEFVKMDYQDYIEQELGITLEEFEAEIDQNAKAELKEKLVLDAISQKENLVLDDTSYEQQLNHLKQIYNYPDIESLTNAIDKNSLQQIAFTNLVKEWLVEQCEIPD